MRNPRRVVAIAVFVGVAGVGALALMSPPTEAKGRCICPQIYAPVECDNGRTFANQCPADCRNAKNCVPVGGLFE